MAGNFTLDMSHFINHAHANIDMVTRKVVLDVMRSVIRKSPVGNPDLWVALRNGDYVDYTSVHGEIDYVGGRFKANWQYSSGSMPGGTVDAINANSGEVISNLSAQVPQQASGKIHYIVNNLPYSIRLENGWSTQAPSGIIGLTISEYQGIVRRAAQEVNP